MEKCKLMLGQIKGCKTPVQAMSRRFGQNAYLRDSIRAAVKDGAITVMQSPTNLNSSKDQQSLPSSAARTLTTFPSKPGDSTRVPRSNEQRAIRGRLLQTYDTCDLEVLPGGTLLEGQGKNCPRNLAPLFGERTPSPSTSLIPLQLL